MFKPLRMKFSKKELVMFGFGMLVMLIISNLTGAKSKQDTTCEKELRDCNQDLDECISILR